MACRHRFGRTHEEAFETHPEAEVYRSQPGLGPALAMRALAGFGDDLERQAQGALVVSPGARQYYDELRARGVGHFPALRQLGNRLVGILHGCLKSGSLYDERTAWAHRHPGSTRGRRDTECPW